MSVLSYLSPAAAAYEQYNTTPQERSGFGQFLYGTPEKFGQLSRFSPQNQNQFNDLISQLLQRLGGNEFSFAPIEEEARAGFSQKTLPSIMERFTALGAGGGRSSAQFNTLGSAGADLERSLASMKQNYNLQRQPLLQNLIGLGAQEPFYQPRTPGFAENLLGQGAQAAGQFGGTAAKLALAGL